jgi:hypothetical protein
MGSTKVSARKKKLELERARIRAEQDDRLGDAIRRRNIALVEAIRRHQRTVFGVRRRVDEFLHRQWEKVNPLAAELYHAHQNGDMTNAFPSANLGGTLPPLGNPILKSPLEIKAEALFRDTQARAAEKRLQEERERYMHLDEDRRQPGAAAQTLGLDGPTLAPLKVFSSGAMRSAKKPEYRLIPGRALDRIAKRFALGAGRFGVNNWKLGGQDFIDDVPNHLIEHLFLWLDGDRSDDHLAAVGWAACALLHFDSEPKADLQEVA